MKRLLNTLFILSDDIYLSLENENVAAWRDDKILQKIPLINLENILYFGYKGASPALLGACGDRGIAFCFMSPSGRMRARTCGMIRGNVLLRKEQYRRSDNEQDSCFIARYFVMGKIYNARTVLMRAVRDHPLSVDRAKFQEICKELLSSAKEARKADNLDVLRGIEGNAAQLYFSLFDQMILWDKKHFTFQGRIKRPPRDPVNALLSFVYTILAHDCAAALESVGLDAYVGFLHRDRPGRVSLALDLMEELRTIYADRFVLTLINNRIISRSHFQEKENGAVWLSGKGRKSLIDQWQEKKRDVIVHPFLQEKICWGLVPYVQALLLSRYLRGDLEEYPAFLWK